MKYFFILLFTFCTSAINAQIQGSTNVIVGNSVTYYYDDGTVYIGVTWNITNGTSTSTWQTGTRYFVNVTWTTAGAGQVRIRENGGTIDYLAITVASLPSIPTGTSASRCGPGSVTLNGVTGSGGNNLRWYDASSGGTLLFTGTSYITPNISTTTNYYIASYNTTTGSESPSRLNLTATINPIPSSPSPIPSGRCGAGTVTLSGSVGSGGTTLQWYSASSGGTLLASGSTTYVTPSINTTTTYYITSYNPSTGCESSPRIAIDASIFPALSDPTPSPGNRCGPGTVILGGTIGAGGNTLRWYSASSGGTLLATATSYTTPVISSSTTYYIVSYNSTTGCESATRIAVVATVTPGPPNPIAAPASRCGLGTVTLSGTVGSGGSNIHWYAASTGGSVLSNMTVYTTPSLSATTTYYITTFNSSSGCESARIPITATINAVPSSPTAVSASRCGTGTLPLTGTPGANASTLRWYVAATGGSPLASATTYTTPSITATTTYYITSYNTASGCESTPRVAVTATVNALPELAAGTDVSRCGAGTVVLNATFGSGGTGVKWYSALTGGSLVFTGLNFTTPSLSSTTTYYIASYTATCESTRVPVAAIINNGQPASSTNYITSTDVLIRGVTNPLSINLLPIESASKSIQYFDGLARPLQGISNQGSPLKQDIVSPTVYDLYGREYRKYLPFVAGCAGSYKSNIIAVDGNYTGEANNTYANNATGKVAQDTRPFSESIFEASPLNRALQNYDPGSSWGPSPGNNKFVAQQYLSNVHSAAATPSVTTQEKVIAWKINATGFPIRELPLINIIETGGYYSSGQLNVNVTTDEQGNAFRTYTNKTGQIILKKVQVVTSSTNLNSISDWALTYYLYDDFGNLRYVFQPELSRKLHSGADSYVITSVDLTNFAFQYKYDSRLRMTEKRVPGADWVYMVYDNRDRLVMTQDGNQRVLSPKQWSFTKYDALNRPVLTGYYQSDIDLTGTQSTVNNFYQNLTSSTAWFEKYIGADAGNVMGYDGKSFPQVSEANCRTAVYYDTYDSFIAPTGFAYNVEVPAIAGQEPSHSARVIGHVTGTQVRNLTWGTWMRTVNYYDAKYHVIQTMSDHFKGNVRTTNILDFPGRIIVSKRTYIVSTVTTTIKETFTYDHVSRLLSVNHSVNGAADVIITKNTYNEIGQLVDKQLHSKDFTNFMQSVDYRYNIRGWLTSMNNASLTSDASNDDTNDFFGMNLSYNTVDADLANAPFYNGNIGSMKWSNYPGTGATKQKGYTYSYDALNRIAGSVFKEKTSSWGAVANNGFRETGYSYDLNGNIKTMQRNDKRGTGWMDNMTYTYGIGTTQSNRLLKVEDTGDDFAGFTDGNPGTTDDYNYDPNGNLIIDLNKGIGNSLTDVTNLITYNYLNLPETITKGGNNVRYLYDANGTKLAQIVTTGTTTKQTDYIGELTYENDALQSINHAEGRIMMASTKLIYTDNGESTSTMTSNLGAATALVTQNGNEKYVRVTSSASAGNGVFPIGGTFNVSGGERYRIRVKGYRNSTGTKDAYLLIKVNGTNVNWPGAKLPASVTNESWVEQIVIIPWLTGGVMPMQVGVIWDAATSGEVTFINEFEITKLETTTPEYQYNLKDHLGNVRLTFTSKEETDGGTATLEAANVNAERSKFLRYDNARKVNYYLFDRTNGVAPSTTPGAAQRLSGKTNEVYGLARSLSVMPGDVINMEVYGKYIDSNTANLTSALGTLVSQIAAGTAPGGTVIDGGGYSSSTASFPFPGGLNGTSSSTGSGPKAYLNWLVFDRNRNLILAKCGYQRLTTAAKETGQDVNHEKLSGTVTIAEPGYVYIYLSNEEGASAYEVYFDQFRVDHIKSPVIQTDDYYPFGLAYNSYSRENSVNQDYKYNGKELQDELNLGWLDYGARMYDPTIGRWSVPDLLSELRFDLTSYRYCYNNPVNYTDPFGLWEEDANGNYSTTDEKDIARFTSYLQAEQAVQTKSANIEQIKGFIGEEKSGGLGKLSNGSHLVSDVSVTGYSSASHVDWSVNEKEMNNAWHEVQGTLTPDALDPRTLNHNIFWLSYPGPDNPKTYAGNDDYSYMPGPVEMPAYRHDKEYDALGIKGAGGLFNDAKALGADFRFVSSQLALSMNPLLSTKDRVESRILGIGLGLSVTPKAINHILPRGQGVDYGINPTRPFE